MNNQDNNIATVEEQGFDPFSMDGSDEIVEEYYEVEETSDVEVDENADVELSEAKEQHSQGKKKLSSEEAYRKLQSEKDKIASEMQKLKAQYEGIDEYIPVVKYIQENPNIIDALEKQLSGNVQQQPEVKAEEPELVKPSRPQKPQNYSRYEAENDPNSESAKYDNSLLEYQEQLIAYNEGIATQYQAKLEREEQQRQMVMKQREQINSTINALMSQHQFSQQEAVDFVKEMTNPRPTLDELVALYRIKRAPKQQTNEVSKEELKQKAEQLKAKQQPLPAGTGGYNQPQGDLSKSFSQSLGRSHSAVDIFALK